MTGEPVVSAQVLRVVPGHPPELVVYDRPSSCPYLPARCARLPLRLPARALRSDELDARLTLGDRRQGFVLYRTSCPDCEDCIPIRLDVERFRLRPSHRRVLARGDRAFQVELRAPSVDARRVELYNKHKLERGLGTDTDLIDQDSYRAFLVETCCDTFELCLYLEQDLVGVSVVDRGFSSLSAVYCYYDPEACGRHSPGTYAILKQLQLCRRWGMRYLYLGLYVQGSAPMAYKAGFLPHQQRRDGRWIDIEDLTQTAPTGVVAGDEPLELKD